jgi:uncharacterized protein YabN with tetrapyrrole methylase and pyrophosphatase domain
MEEMIQAENKSIQSMNLAEMDIFWDAAKKKLK